MTSTNRIDVKSQKLNALGKLLNMPEAGLTKNKLILLTDSSMIYGSLVKQEDILSNNVDVQLKPYEVTLQASKNAYSIAQKENINTINNSVSIVLKDVTIIPFATPNVKINFSSICVFSDKIVGFTYGNLDTTGR